MADADARDSGSPRDADVVPEAGRGVDLQPDVERLHRAIRREPRDPVEGREPIPWFFTAAIAVSFIWGGWYLGRFGGEFNRATHLAYATRQPAITASANAQSAAAITNPVAAGKNVYEKNCVACHQGTGATYNGAMPAWKEVLKDEEIAAVATYLRQWAPNAAPPIPPATVAELRKADADRTQPWTAAALTSAVNAGATP